jgi:hypothetical protein
VRHARQELADFQNGETRLVYARQKDGQPDLYYLVDGTARELRQFVRDCLLCPIPDCAASALKVVARSPRGRDGFSHLPGAGGHAAESLFHLQGKARIAQWLTQCYPNSLVVEEQASNAARDRIADVMITARSGHRVAIEIQYAALPPDKWLERHADYVKQGITDVWLFGHTGAQMKLNRSDWREGDVKLNPTHEAVVAAGLPLLWFNPVLGQVATATDPSSYPTKGLRVPASTRTGFIDIEQLDAFQLAADGLWSDSTRNLALTAAKVAAALLAEQERQERAEAELVERKRLAAEETARALADWEASPEREAILEQFGGAWPAFLDVRVYGTSTKTTIPRQQWQAYLFVRRQELAGEKGHFPIQTCMEALPGVFESEDNARRAIRVWFGELVANQYLKSTMFRGKDGKPRTTYHLNDPAENDRRLAARYPALYAKSQEAPARSLYPVTAAPEKPAWHTSLSVEELAVLRAGPQRTRTCPICRMPLHGPEALCLPY